MGVVKTILLVAFIIICVLIVFFVAIQNENDGGMGGVFGGGQSAAFGAHSASVLTKTTGVLVALFFVLAFFLAILNKGDAKKADLSAAAAEVQGIESTADSPDASSNWWDSTDSSAE